MQCIAFSGLEGLFCPMVLIFPCSQFINIVVFATEPLCFSYKNEKETSSK